jgi:hypothetical protein
MNVTSSLILTDPLTDRHDIAEIFLTVALNTINQINFQWDDDEVHFELDQHAELDYYRASSLKQQSACRHIAPLGHIILIPSQPVFDVA